MQKPVNNVAQMMAQYSVQNVQTFADAREQAWYGEASRNGAGGANWGAGAACLLHLICNFPIMLRISMYGLSDLLSSLYAACACTGDLRTEVSS